MVVYDFSFQQKTAYEMRISDWSSDVCSSDLVHEYVEPIAGEAWDGGPLVLSWEDAQQSATGAGAAYSVVIHEFVHKIDLLDGDADGVERKSVVMGKRV